MPYKNKQTRNQYLKKRRALGLVPQSPEYRTYYREWRRTQRERLKAAGLCRQCQQPIALEETECSACRLKNAKPYGGLWDQDNGSPAMQDRRRNGKPSQSLAWALLMRRA